MRRPPWPVAVAWRLLGRCEDCGQLCFETDAGSIVGHLDDCPRWGQEP